MSETIEPVQTPVIEEQQAEIPEGMTTEQAKTIQKLILKVDGQEIEELLPFGIPEEHAEYIRQQLQLAKASQKRMQETAELRKSSMKQNQELDQFLNTLKSNPELILSHMGHDVKKFAEQILSREVELMEMSPEERKIHELQKEVAKLKKEEESRESSRKESEMNSLRDKYAAEFERDLLEAMNGSSLPNNPEVLQRLTGMMRTALKNDINISFKDLIPIVQEQMETDMQSLIGKMPSEMIEKILGASKVDEIMKRKQPKVKKVAPPTSSSIKDSGSAKSNKEPEAKKRVPIKDFFRNL